MKGFSGLIVGFLITGLFVFALLIGGAQLSANNAGSQSINNQPQIARITQNLTSELNNAYTSANKSEAAVSGSQTTITQDSIFLDAIAGVWKTMKVVPLAVYNLMAAFIETTMFSGGSSYIIMGVIGAIIIFLFVLYAWKVIRTGDPE